MNVNKFIDNNSISDFEFELISEIVNLRLKNGLTQKELSELTGIPQPNIARFEKNIHSSSLSTTIRILSSMGYKLKIEKM